MARLATLNAIQCCPKCHYCSTDITEISGSGATILGTQRYRDTFESKSLPELCRKWSCWGQVLEASQHYAEAGWAFLSAAWSCDDSRQRETAIHYRRESIRLFETAQHLACAFGSDPEIETLVLVDLHRRVGNFEHAAQLAHSILEDSKPEINGEKQLKQAIRHFQLHLISTGDTRSYSYAEADRFARNPLRWHPRQWWEIWR